MVNQVKIFASFNVQALHTGCPPYIANFLQYQSKATCPSASHLLSVPQLNLASGSRAFCICTKNNSLPPNIPPSQTLVPTTLQNSFADFPGQNESFSLTSLFTQNTNKTTVVVLLHQMCDIL